jgi:hemerythrin-like domain-containing protein
MLESVTMLERLAREHHALMGLLREMELLAVRLEAENEDDEDDIGPSLDSIVEAMQAHLLCHMETTEELVYAALAREFGGPEPETDALAIEHRELQGWMARLELQRRAVDVADTAAAAADVCRSLRAAAAVIGLHVQKEELIYFRLLGDRLRPNPTRPA